MTVSTLTNTVTYPGNGATTQWPFAFPVQSPTFLVVTITDPFGFPTVLSATQYSTSGIGSAQGGKVFYPISGAPIPEDGTTITIDRVLPIVQNTKLGGQDGYYPQVVEGAFDYVTELIQQQGTDIARVRTMISNLVAGIIIPDPTGGAAVARLTSQLAGGTVGTGTDLVGYLPPFVGGELRTLTDKSAQTIELNDFGPLGTANDTTTLDKAMAYALNNPGKTITAPPTLMPITRSIRIPSQTALVGPPGAKIMAHQTAFVGLNTGVNATTNCQLIQNYNFAASALTDQDIRIEGISFDYGSVVIAGGGAHAVTMRFVRRPRAVAIYGQNGENLTAFRSCLDSRVVGCDAKDMSNCYFDHWETSGNALVAFSTGRNASGKYINQGIQVNNTADGSNGTSSELLSIGNQLYGVRALSGGASALAYGAIDNGSGAVVRHVRSIGNYVENSDTGLVFAGALQAGLSMGDTFKNVDQLPIFFQQVGGATPSFCRVLDPHLIDCNHTVGNVAMISISGTENSVRNVKVSNTSGVPLYQIIAWMTGLATNCIVEIDEAQTGSGARILNGGTSCRSIDTLDTYGTAGFTPTLGAATGTFTTATATGEYTKLGRMVLVNYLVAITTNGSAAGSITLTLPFPAESTHFAFTGRANTTGQGVIATALDGNTIFIAHNDGTYPGSTGEQIVLSGMYRSAS